MLEFVIAACTVDAFKMTFDFFRISKMHAALGIVTLLVVKTGVAFK